ncbi:hypothetical protein OS493_022792 [Desmophyllum pertusum]|uniref:Uncharacterized protein n=1 Tax=Desmophyllum pertusum TaxID=174260 RepID=A0A9W9ZZG7_9CNID|nr:hypothetical protein OS493_022792 [Desmophyllum pertusum]
MKTSLASCPEHLSVSLPLFSTDTVTYIQWSPDSNNLSPLQLHHESLSIPPSIAINRTVINDLDELFEYYDSQLSLAIEKADGMTNEIEETTESTLTEYIAFGALGLSLSNFIILCVTCRCTFRTAGHHNKDHQLGDISTPAHQVCKHCKKTVKKRRTTATTEGNIKEK